MSTQPGQQRLVSCCVAVEARQHQGSELRLVRPYAVDVASGVERAPGVKDAELMRRFIGNALDAAAR